MDRDLVKLMARTRKLPRYLLLSSLRTEEVSHALGIWSKLSRPENLSKVISSRKERGISHEIDDDLFQRYQQCEIQELPDSGDPAIRENYRNPRDAATIASIESRVGAVCRTRITSLNPGANIPRHFDDPRQRRVIVLLRGSDKFSLSTSAGTSTIPMAIGELWYVNTAFEHEVRNLGQEPRVALIADVVDTATFDKKLQSMDASEH